MDTLNNNFDCEFLSFDAEIRRQALIHKIQTASDEEFAQYKDLTFGQTKDEIVDGLTHMSDKVFDRLCFHIFAPEEAILAWDEIIEMTQERFDLCARITNRMAAPEMIFSLYKKYPQLVHHLF